MAEAISSSEELRDWLEGKDRSVAVAIASRAVLRVVPLVWQEISGKSAHSSIDIRTILSLFRVIAFPCFTGSWPHQLIMDTIFFENAVSRASNYKSDSCRAAVLAARSYISNSASSNSAKLSVRAIEIAANSAHRSALFSARYPTDGPWVEVSKDLVEIESGIAPSELMRNSIWFYGMPDMIHVRWEKIKLDLLELDENWQVWTDWYEDRLRGAADPKSRPLIEALELERVLIDDEDWEQGAAHVNAMIAEMEARHRAQVPEQRPASIEVEYGEDGKLHCRASPPPEARDIAQDQRLQAAWAAHSDQLAGLEALDPGKNLPTFGRAMRDYRRALGATYDEMNVIALGVHGSRLNSFSERADELFLEEAASEVQALNANHGLFIRQFEAWNDYIADASPEPSAETLDAAIDFARSLNDAPELIAEDVSEPINALADAVAADRTLVANTEDGLAQELLRSEGNVLSGLLGPVLAYYRDVKSAAREGSIEGVKEGSRDVAKTAIQFAALAPVLALAASYPAAFGWILPVLAYLKIRQKK